MRPGDVVGVLLAAGAGSRFGGNKLEAEFEGAMLGVHAARAMAAAGFGGLIVVENPAHARLHAALSELGFARVANDAPALGLSHSLRRAVRAAAGGEAAAMIIVLADMPFVTTAHLLKICAAARAAPGRAVASEGSDGVRSPPALFPRAQWEALAAAEGDQGARALLHAAVGIVTEATTLTDIDRKADIFGLSSRRKLTTGIS